MVALAYRKGRNPKPPHELFRPALSNQVAFMSDIRSVLEKLRSEVAECLVLSNVATDPEKRQLFARVAERISGLASAVQSELVTEPAKATYGLQQPADLVPIFDPKRMDAADSTIVPKLPMKSRMRAWLAVVFLIAGAGAFVLARAEKDSSVPALQAKIEPKPAPQEGAKEAIGEFRSAEEGKQKVLSQQLELLASRIDNLERAHAEVEGRATNAEPLLSPPTKHRTQTLQPSRHRRTSSSNSYGSSSSKGRRSGWFFGGSPIFRF